MVSDEGGFTLIEVLTASALFLIALAMFGSVLFTVQRAADRQFELSQANDGARLAIQEIDRQLRSGYVAAQPLITGTSASAVIYTEARMRTTTDVPKCVAWVVAPYGSSEALYTRVWDASNLPPPLTWSAGGTGWRRVVEGIVNSQMPGTPSAFQLTAVATGGGNLVSQFLAIQLWLNPSSVRVSQITEVRSTITARNFLRSQSDAEVTGGVLGARDALCVP